MFDFVITLIFLIIFKFYGLSFALTAMIALSLLWLAYHLITQKQITLLKAFTHLSIIFFSMISLIFQSPKAFQFKTSVIYGVTGLVCLITPWIKKKTLLEILCLIPLKDSYYRHINRALVTLLLTASLLNTYVVVNYTLEQWVYFKFFLSFVVTFFLGICLAVVFKEVKNN
jgi:intracellular septation protein A